MVRKNVKITVNMVRMTTKLVGPNTIERGRSLNAEISRRSVVVWLLTVRVGEAGRGSW